MRDAAKCSPGSRPPWARSTSLKTASAAKNSTAAMIVRRSSRRERDGAGALHDVCRATTLASLLSVDEPASASVEGRVESRRRFQYGRGRFTRHAPSWACFHRVSLHNSRAQGKGKIGKIAMTGAWGRRGTGSNRVVGQGAVIRGGTSPHCEVGFTRASVHRQIVARAAERVANHPVSHAGSQPFRPTGVAIHPPGSRRDRRVLHAWIRLAQELLGGWVWASGS